MKELKIRQIIYSPLEISTYICICNMHRRITQRVKLYRVRALLLRRHRSQLLPVLISFKGKEQYSHLEYLARALIVPFVIVDSAELCTRRARALKYSFKSECSREKMEVNKKKVQRAHKLWRKKKKRRSHTCMGKHIANCTGTSIWAYCHTFAVGRRQPHFRALGMQW